MHVGASWICDLVPKHRHIGLCTACGSQFAAHVIAMHLSAELIGSPTEGVPDSLLLTIGVPGVQVSAS